MADELSISLAATLTNSYSKGTFAPGAIAVTQSAIGGHRPIVSVGNGAEEDLSTGDVGTLGWLFMRNLDTVNYVTWGPKSAGSMVAIGRIKAGEVACFRLEPGVTLRWQANTAAVKVEIWVLEN